MRPVLLTHSANAINRYKHEIFDYAREHKRREFGNLQSGDTTEPSRLSTIPQ
jgi:hypothetical protein